MKKLTQEENDTLEQILINEIDYFNCDDKDYANYLIGIWEKITSMSQFNKNLTLFNWKSERDEEQCN